jgi:DNA primase large subunit
MQRLTAKPEPRAAKEALNAFASDDLGLSLYTVPPDVIVSVHEFEDYTKERLKVLHAIDRLCGYDYRLEQISELRPKLAKDISENRLSLGYPAGKSRDVFLAEKADFMRRDSISHYALRIAFCKTRDAREWCVRQEQRLFMLRFEALNAEAREAYLELAGVKCTRFQQQPGITLDQLQKMTAGAKIWSKEAGGRPTYEQQFYEMPFQDVTPSLIASRKVVLKAGKAFVPAGAMKLILSKRFKDLLTASLDVAFQGLPLALADARVGGFLRDVQEYGMQLMVAKKPSSDEDIGEKLTLGNFEELLTRSFPPCMRRTVEKQRDMKKHLKHAGRLQLRPFLKDCGFTFEESLRWWKQELCRDPTVDPASVEKNYTYDVEHAYGKKGHLQGQNTFGCPKMLQFPGESVGQVHGCCFKQLDPPALRQQLHRWKVGDTHLVEIEKLITQGKHYQLACIEYFKALHPGSEGDGVGNAPRDYFKESCRYHIKKKENASTTKSSSGSSVPVK